MKIAFCIGQLSKGGAERVVCNLANYFSTSNDVSIISLRNTEIGYDLSNSVKVHFLDSKSKNGKIIKNINRYSSMKKIFIKENFDIIICFLPEPSFIALSLKKYVSSKFIVSVRNDPKIEYKSFLYYLLMKLLYPLADGFVFQTDDAKKYFNKSIRDKSRVIFNSVNPAFLLSSLPAKREKLVVSVGRLDPQKNQMLLINSFCNIHSSFPDYKLIIYGEGPLRPTLEKYIKSINMDKYIFLPGVVDDVINYIFDASVFVLSSDYEGMPNALMEALSLGIPCISTDCPCGGPSSLIVDGENGFLVDVNNVSQLSSKLSLLLSDKKIRDKFSSNCFIKRSSFDPVIINKEWADFIYNIYSGGVIDE